MNKTIIIFSILLVFIIGFVIGTKMYSDDYLDYRARYDKCVLNFLINLPECNDDEKINCFYNYELSNHYEDNIICQYDLIERNSQRGMFCKK